MYFVALLAKKYKVGPKGPNKYVSTRAADKKICPLLRSISPTYLWEAFTYVDPKSVKFSQIVSIFLRFWDLRMQNLLVEQRFKSRFCAPRSQIYFKMLLIIHKILGTLKNWVSRKKFHDSMSFCAFGICLRKSST